MEKERDATGIALIAAADRVVDLVEQSKALDEWLNEEFYAEGEELTQ
jgi:hypothetical protein